MKPPAAGTSTSEPNTAVDDTPLEDDRALLAQARARGGAAMAREIYQRFSAQVNATVWRLLGPDADHDDLVSEVILRIIDRFEKLSNAERLSGWATTITVNLVRDEMRKRSVRKRFLRRAGPLELEDRPASTPGPDDEARRLVRQAFAVMSRLPADERLAFTLRHVEGRTLPETAELCGCSLATAKRRISRAQQRFRALATGLPELAEWMAAQAKRLATEPGMGDRGLTRPGKVEQAAGEQGKVEQAQSHEQ